MSNLKKFNNDNHIHFITFNTFGKIKINKDGQKYYEGYPYFKNEKYCSILIEEFNFYRKKLGFKIFGYVIMPNHVHMLIWWDIIERAELTIGKIMQGIKSHSAKEIVYFLQMGRRKPSLSPMTNQLERGLEPTRIKYKWMDCGVVHTPAKHKIWQKDSYDFNIFTLEKYQEKLNYIHNNPVRAKMVEKPQDYKWSSYHSLYLDDHSVLKVDQIEL